MKINKTSEGSRKTDISGIIYLGIMVVMVMCCRPAWSDTWFVATNGSDATGSGSDASPWLTISNAIGHSVDNDTVVISSGIYALDDQLVVTNGITLRTYNNDRAKVVINGNNYADKLVTNRCLFVNHTNAFISGLTFSNGVVNIASAFGGGAILIMTNGTVSNCIITWSKAADGGGVYMNKGGLLLNSLISYNFVSNSVFPSGRGGGIYINTAGTVRDCTIFTNQAFRSSGHGAGIYLITGGTVDRCDVVSNIAYGGAIYMNTCGGTIRDTTIRQNYTDDSTIRVADGAGSPIAVITNCTIMSNIFAFIGCVYFAVPARLEHCDIMYNESTSADDGVNIPVSAIYIASIGSAKSIIRNCRIMNNSAASAVNNGMAVWIASNAVIENCLISGHDKGGVRTGTNAYGMILSSCTIANNTKYGVYMNTDAGYTNAVTNCIIYTNGTADITNKVEACTNFFWYCCASNPLPASQGNIASDPLFEGISTNNYRLAAGSPCINRGINLPWMINDVDLDGKKRIMMRNVDIGAYEAWPPSGTIFYGR